MLSAIVYSLDTAYDFSLNTSWGDSLQARRLAVRATLIVVPSARKYCVPTALVTTTNRSSSTQNS